MTSGEQRAALQHQINARTPVGLSVPLCKWTPIEDNQEHDRVVFSIDAEKLCNSLIDLMLGVEVKQYKPKHKLVVEDLEEDCANMIMECLNALPTSVTTISMRKIRTGIKDSYQREYSDTTFQRGRDLALEQIGGILWKQYKSSLLRVVDDD